MFDREINKIFKNWKVVLFSFLGATTFWLFTALNKDYSALVSYPINFEFDEDSVVVIDPLPEVVKVDVSSGGWNLLRRTLWFSVTPLKVELDNPTDIRFLTRSTLLRVVQDQLRGLAVNYLLTDTLFINIERKVQKKVDIKVDSINISLSNNYRIVSPLLIDPPYVILVGPETIIGSLQDEYFVMVDNNRISGDISEEVDIPLRFEDIMKAYPSSITVSFEVDRFDRDRIQIPLEKIDFPEDESIYPEDSIITVNYTIQRSLKEEFSSTDFVITIDYNMLKIGDSTIQPIMIYFPEIIDEISLNPEQIKILYD